EAGTDPGSTNCNPAVCARAAEPPAAANATASAIPRTTDATHDFLIRIPSLANPLASELRHLDYSLLPPGRYGNEVPPQWKNPKKSSFLGQGGQGGHGDFPLREISGIILTLNTDRCVL